MQDVPADWQYQGEITREIGTAWLRGNSSLLLKVPSAIVPATFNLLFNPTHPEARNFRIAEVITYPFDTRLKD